MKRRFISVFLMLSMLVGVFPFYALSFEYGPWSDWGTERPAEQDGREIETREVVMGYNMVHYLTMTNDGVRQYRSYSVDGNYDAYSLRTAYGEHHRTWYAEKSVIDSADTSEEGDYINYADNTAGYNMGSGRAYVGWNVQDCLVWFIESEVKGTEYRYRDARTEQTASNLNDHTYKVYDLSMTWEEAEKYCENLGGHLATVTSASEQRLIEEHISSGDKNCYWLGGTDRELEGEWKWVTGESWTYSNWLNDEPSNCAYYSNMNPENYLTTGKGYAWNDLQNDGDPYGDRVLTNIGFVCEWDSYGVSDSFVKNGESDTINGKDLSATDSDFGGSNQNSTNKQAKAGAYISSEVEENNQITTANDISLDTTVTGRVSQYGDEDWYRFTLSSAGLVSVTFEHEYINSAASYWSSTFINRNKEELGGWNWRGDALSEESSEATGLEAGTYYLRITRCGYNHSDIDYHFKVNYIQTDLCEKELNNTIITATDIPVNQKISGYICHYDDEDWYKIELPSDGVVSLTFDHEYINNNSNYWGTAFLSSKKESISENAWNGNALSPGTSQEVGLPAGTYYLLITRCGYNHSTNGYVFTIHYSQSGDWEKELNDMIITANPIITNGIISGSISLYNDVDWFKFSVPENGRMSVYFDHDFIDSSSNYWTTTLKSNDNQDINSWSWRGNTTESAKTDAMELKAGTYYLIVTRCGYNHSLLTYHFSILIGRDTLETTQQPAPTITPRPTATPTPTLRPTATPTVTPRPTSPPTTTPRPTTTPTATSTPGSDHTHDMIAVQGAAATCTKSGTQAYWYCSKCKKCFSDRSGLNEIDHDSIEIYPLGHNYVNGICTRDGARDPNYVSSNTTSDTTVSTGSDVHFPQITVYYSDQFTDVPFGQWFTPSVASAFSLGLMKGNSETTFNPYGDVTIAEAITMAARIHSLYSTGEEHFDQQRGGKWYQTYLDYAYYTGIISNAYYNSDVTHKATRAAFAEILSNSLPAEALSEINSVPDNSIPDVRMTDSCAPFVYKLYRAGILSGGDASGTFSPLSYITRAEAAAIVSRMAESDNRKTFSLGTTSVSTALTSTVMASPSSKTDGLSGVYAFVLSDCSWTEAFERAKRSGGVLAVVETEEDFERLTRDAELLGLTDVELRLGGRREDDSKQYYWVTSSNKPYGEALNSSSSWIKDKWLTGEPNYSWKGTEETCVELYKDSQSGQWVLNDVPNQPTGDSSIGHYGYVIAYPQRLIDGAYMQMAPLRYAFIYDDCTWTEAFEKAKQSGGTLACFETEQEFETVKQELKNLGIKNARFCIGGRRDVGATEYYWRDKNGKAYGNRLDQGTDWTAQAWVSGEPSLQWGELQEQYMALSYNSAADDWFWNDIVGWWEDFTADRFGYIIEYPVSE